MVCYEFWSMYLPRITLGIMKMIGLKSPLGGPGILLHNRRSYLVVRVALEVPRQPDRARPLVQTESSIRIASEDRVFQAGVVSVTVQVEGLDRCHDVATWGEVHHRHRVVVVDGEDEHRAVVVDIGHSDDDDGRRTVDLLARVHVVLSSDDQRADTSPGPPDPAISSSRSPRSSYRSRRHTWRPLLPGIRTRTSCKERHPDRWRRPVPPPIQPRRSLRRRTNNSPGKTRVVRR